MCHSLSPSNSILLMSITAILEEHLSPALEVSEENAAIFNGVEKEVAEAHRAFGKATPEEQARLIASGEF